MKKILLVLFLMVGLCYAQAPLFGTQANVNGAACAVQTFNSTDSIFTSPIFYWKPNYQLFTGAATLHGRMDLTAGTDSITTFSARLVMKDVAQIDGGVMYDSSGWHTLSANMGDYIPAENDVGATGIDFSVDLAEMNWWKPSLGIVIKAHTSPGSNATRVKRLELYLSHIMGKLSGY